jgi:glycosyltransferase involved in cell wall biosynthesis
MAKIAIFTLTRDRLAYTKKSFKSLKKNAGYPYTHFIIDNGSTDGTQEWLKKQKDLEIISLEKKNIGISKASNKVLDVILKQDFDLIIKFDNDCEVISSDILKELIEVYETIPPFYSKFMLSPRVEGLNFQPQRGERMTINKHAVGITKIIGGIFQPMPAECYKLYRYNEKLPKAKGQDEDITLWFRQLGGQVGYIEDLIVEHIDSTEGQKKKYPAYFKRKNKEEVL